MAATARLDTNRMYDPRFPGIWIACTPANSDLTYVAYAVKCTVAGNISLRNAEDASTVVMPIAVGEVICGRFDRVNSTSTTATGIFIAY